MIVILRYVVILCAFSALGRSQSDEIAIPPRYVPAPAAPTTVSVASKGSEFLAVWQDYRGSGRIRATRVSSAGEVLDPLGIEPGALPLPLPLSGDGPLVVWGGTSWVVVWTSRNSAAVSAAHLDRNGHLLGAPVTLAQGRRCCDANSIAVNGSRILIGFRSNGDRALVVDEATFRVLGDVSIGNSPDNRFAFVAYGDGFVAFSQERSSGNEIHWQEIDRDAHVKRSGFFSSPLYLTAAATDGKDFLLMGFSGTAVTASTRPASIRVAGNLAGGIQSTALFPNYAPTVRAMWMGDHYLALRHARTLVLSRMDRDGHFTSEVDTGHVLFQCCTYPTAADFATNGTSLFVASGGTTFNGQLFSHSWSTPATERFALTMSAASQDAPALASSGQGTELLVWREDQRATGSRIRDAESLDGTGVQVLPTIRSNGLGPENLPMRTQPASVVFDGEQFMLPYVTVFGDVQARFVSPMAGLLPGGLAISRPFGTPAAWLKPAAAAGRKSTLVVWVESAQQRIIGATIDPSSRTVAVAPLQIAHTASPDKRFTQPAVAWNGTHYLVIWYELRAAPSNAPSALLAIRVSEDVLPIDAEPRTLATFSPGATTSELAVASDGKDWLATWNGVARRVRADGSLGESGSLPFGTKALTWTGRRYVFAWADGRDVKIAEVPSSGPILITPATIASANAISEVSLATIGLDRVAVGYSRIADEAVYGGIRRVFVRHVTFSTEPRQRSARH